MKVATLIYRETAARVEVSLTLLGPLANEIIADHPVPVSPNLGVFPQHDCVVISHTEYVGDDSRNWLEVYRLSDWRLRARLPIDCRPHFNVCPQWSTFLDSPGENLIYVYKARSLGDHLAEDYICGLDLASMELCAWDFKIPECMFGWSLAAGRSHAQMLFVADGIELGALPEIDLDQKLGFWLGPKEGMGPVISMGKRPKVHNDPGHARAVLSAADRPVSAVVCDDGAVHLIDPIEFRYLERQQVQLQEGQGMPNFAAQIDRAGRRLYVGSASGESRYQGLTQQIVVHDLETKSLQDIWDLPDAFRHMALTEDGKYLCGAAPLTNKVWVLDSRDGSVVAVQQMDGSPRYVVPFA